MLAWDVMIHMKKEEVLSVFSLFFDGVGVYMGVCVCVRTRIDTQHVGYSDLTPGVRMRH